MRSRRQSARLKGDQLEPSPQLGFTGAGALDRQGRVVGMVQLKPPATAATGVSSAPALATLVPAATIRALLEAHRIVPAAEWPHRDRGGEGVGGAGDLRAQVVDAEVSRPNVHAGSEDIWGIPRYHYVSLHERNQ